MGFSKTSSPLEIKVTKLNTDILKFILIKIKYLLYLEGDFNTISLNAY